MVVPGGLAIRILADASLKESKMNTLDQAANALDAGLLVIVCTARLSAETQTMVPAAEDTADATLFQNVAIHVSSMKTKRADPDRSGRRTRPTAISGCRDGLSRLHGQSFVARHAVGHEEATKPGNDTFPPPSARARRASSRVMPAAARRAMHEHMHPLSLWGTAPGRAIAQLRDHRR
jgi:hypothetical protein